VFINATDVRFAYDAPPKHARFVIDSVSLSIARGSATALLGPNGSGKTTLLKLLSGVLRPTSGRVTLEGQELFARSRTEVARRLAVVPQETHSAFDYTVLEMVLMGRYPWLGAFEVEGPADIDVALHALEATGTSALADRAFPTLSGGEKQRVVIASALAQIDAGHGGPPDGVVLLLDEPTTSLDLHYQLGIAAIIKSLRESKGITIVLSTHDLRLARSLCERAVLISGGRVLADGQTANVLSADLVSRLYDVPAEVVAPLLT
jgi:iron complex transport system ATP-binding protein